MTDPDVEQPDWELSKENFQPLRQGRKGAGLKDNTEELRSANLDAVKRQFWQAIADDQSDDPLAAWQRFIDWTRETYTAGGHKAELIPLLERCTSTLQSDERYRNDPRFLRIWILYADCLAEPEDVFSFLAQNDIGQGHALFHIAHATCLELRGAFGRADAAYLRGIDLHAAPLERLKAKHTEFQYRMARRIQRDAAASATALGPVETGAAAPARRFGQAVGALGGARPPGGRPAFAPLGRAAAAAAGQVRGGPAAGAAPLSVLADEPGAPACPGPSLTARSGSTPTWTRLTPAAVGRKENTQAALPWVGQRLEQDGSAATEPAPALEVFADPELEASQAQDRQRLLGVQQGTLRDHLEGKRGAEAGLHPSTSSIAAPGASDPLRLHKQNLERGRAQGARPEEVLACDTQLLRGPDGEELSFEEVRARVMLSRLRPSQAEPGPPAAASIDSACWAEPSAIHPALVGAVAGSQQASECESPPDTRRQAFKLRRQRRSSIMPGLRGREPTMTIATAGAFAAIGSYFEGGLSAEHAFQPPTAFGGDPTMTISTHAAFQAVNDMFAGPASSAWSLSAPAERQEHGPARPQIVSGSPDEGGFCIREDTQILPHTPAEHGSSLLDIRQDTGLLDPGDQLSVHPAQGTDLGFDIREDTCFLSYSNA
ncbi:hypothetical protein ACKKBG_A13730 [Auxenochlorella protothecoides x Auxenochlorella symbiontica]